MSHRRLRKSAVLVTGSSGFIGSHLCEHLVSNLNCNVVGVDSTEVNSKIFDTDNYKFVRADIANNDHVEDIYRENNFDFIFHLAAIANPRTCKSNFDLALRVNVMGTKNIIENSEKNSRLIFVSSASVYGTPKVVPIKEEQPSSGNDPYAITKMMGENLCRCFIENYNHEICIARNFNTFGSGQVEGYIIPTLLKQAMTEERLEIWNSDPVRDFLYIDNTISAFSAIAEQGTNGEIYNIGSGIGTRIGELAFEIRDIVNKDLEVIDLKKPVTGSPELVAANEKLKSLGWNIAVNFSEGLRRTIEWYRITCEGNTN